MGGRGRTLPGRGFHWLFVTNRAWGVLIAAITVVIGIAIPSVSFADSGTGCDFTSGSTILCSDHLSGSSFAGGDGNLLTNPTTYGTTDWQNVSGLNTGIDKASGSGDNAFGQGTKEDNPNATVVSGSIPPNKSDLTRFYEASEFANGSNFLYLAWERSNVLGNANMDFEINQAGTPDLGTAGSHTINRTAGDLLVTFDFTNGGGKPTLGLLKWVTTGPVSQCYSSNALPCWGNHVTLNGTDSIGAVNTDTVSDPIAGVNLPGLTFGETAINLTTAGVFPAGTCTAFGSAFLKSRAASSFSAEVKDFVAPVSVDISNCGTIKVTKITENGNDTFGYTTTGGLTPSTFTLTNGQTRTYGPETVPPGDYSVTESTVPSGWTLKDLSCQASGNGTTKSISGATASIHMEPQGEVDCTYTNHINLGPSISTLLSDATVNIGDQVHDTATLTGATADAGGTVTYTVYDNNTCSGTGTDAGTVTVTNGNVPDSNPVTFTNAGTYYWQAVYSGDDRNSRATSDCTSEKLVVQPNSSAIKTAQHVIPNDEATLSGVTANAGGTITFRLYAPGDMSCSGTPAYTQQVNVSGNGTYQTTNSSFIASDSGEWRWLVVYSGDGNNQGNTSDCGVENFTITNG
jgi:hypothetical protein